MNIYTIENPMSTKDNVLMSIDAYNERNTITKDKNQEALHESIESSNMNIYNTINKRDESQERYATFSEDVKTALLCEALFKIYKESTGISVHHTNDNNVAMNLIGSIVNENGVNSMLRKMATKNILVSELARIINKTHSRILEKANKDDDTLTIPSDIKDDFFEDLNMCDVGDATTSIAMRVSSAVDEFISMNIEMKNEIEKFMTETKEKVAISKTDVAKEAAEFRCGVNINDIRNRKNTNVFGEMVTCMSESVIKNNQLSIQFMNEGKFDFQKIVDRTKIMYSIMEMMNTIEIINVNESYIRNVIDSLKK